MPEIEWARHKGMDVQGRVNPAPTPEPIEDSPASDSTEPLEDMTNERLRALCAVRGIEYKDMKNKAALIAALKEAD